MCSALCFCAQFFFLLRLSMAHCYTKKIQFIHKELLRCHKLCDVKLSSTRGASPVLGLASTFTFASAWTRFVRLHVGGIPQSKSQGLFFLEYFSVRYFKGPLENCFSEKTMITFVKCAP